MRADGSPTSILASVVDDVEYGTTHIIRGDDNAGNTAVQIELSRFCAALARPVPVRFGHLPAITGRRTGTMAVRGLRADGIEPCAIAACMTGIAGPHGEPMPLDDLAGQFDLASLATAGFDVSRLLEINRAVLGGLPFAAVADRLPGGATEAFWLAGARPPRSAKGGKRLVGRGRRHHRAAGDRGRQGAAADRR